MSAQKLWVPGEECDGGLLVTDARSGRELLVRAGETGHLDVPRSGGRVARYAAVRGTVVSREGQFALVKLADGTKVTVRVVGAWQFGTGKRPKGEDAGELVA